MEGCKIRTYGRDSTGTWIEITETSYIWLATLTQTLRLFEQESPFYANYGIPAGSAVQTQVAPDYAVSRTQSQYAGYFASLIVIKTQNTFEPTYNINAVFMDGTVIQNTVAT